MNQKMKNELIEKIIKMTKMIDENDRGDRRISEVSMYV